MLRDRDCRSRKVRAPPLPPQPRSPGAQGAYLRAVGLGHVAQHEERDVEQQGPDRGSLGWGRRNKDLRDLTQHREADGRHCELGGRGPASSGVLS